MLTRRICLFLVLFISGIHYGSAQLQGASCPDDLFPLQDKATRLWGYVDFTTQWIIQPQYIKALPFRGKRALVMKGSKWGAINCDGYLEINAEYDDFSPFNGDRVWAKKDGLWGIISDKGMVYTRPQFDEISIVGKEEDFVWVRKGELWGLFSVAKNKAITPPRFLSFVTTSDETSIVRLGDSLGVIDHEKGTYKIPPNMTDVVRMDKKRIAYEQNGQWGMMNEFGNPIIKPAFDTLFYKKAGLVQVRKNGKHGLRGFNGDTLTTLKYDYIGPFEGTLPAVAQEGKAYGYITNFGKQAIAAQYDFASPFYEGLAIVQKGGKSGLIDRYNKVVLPLAYDSVQRNPHRSYYAVKQNGKFGFVNVRGILMSDISFDKIANADSAAYVRVTKAGKVSYYDFVKKKNTFEGSYDNALPFDKLGALVQQGGNWGLIGSQGQFIIPAQFTSLKTILIHGKPFFLTEKSGAFGLITVQGKEVLPANYELIAAIDDRTFKIKKGGKYGTVKAGGEAVIDTKYDYLSNSVENEGWPEFPAVFSKGKKTGLLTAQGQEVYSGAGTIIYGNEGFYIVQKEKGFVLMKGNATELAGVNYEAIKPYADKLAAVKQAGKWGYITGQGKLIIPATFEEAGDFYKNGAAVKQNGLWAVIDKTGRVRVQPQFDRYEVINGHRYLYKGTARFELVENFRVK